MARSRTAPCRAPCEFASLPSCAVHDLLGISDEFAIFLDLFARAVPWVSSLIFIRRRARASMRNPWIRCSEVSQRQTREDRRVTARRTTCITNPYRSGDGIVVCCNCSVHPQPRPMSGPHPRPLAPQIH